MKDNNMNRLILEELKKYAPVLERHFRDMVDMEFTIENGVFYLLKAKKGKRTALANLKIVMSMFCEGVMSAEDVMLSLNPEQIQNIINTEILTNAHELNALVHGTPACAGVGVGLVCFSYDAAMRLMDKEQDYIYCRWEVSPEDIGIISSPYCKAVITARGGMTSHAAVACRRMGVACVAGFADYEMLKHILEGYGNFATVDGNNGCIYGGMGNVEKSQVVMPEVTLLFQLLKIIIKYNVVSPATAPIVWRLWNIVVLGCRYGPGNGAKRFVNKELTRYISFSRPSQDEIDRINRNLYSLDNASMLIKDFIDFMTSQLSSEVSLGNHYLYMRPLLNPMENMCFYASQKKGAAGCQLVGVEFFHVNRFVDYLLDIESVKLYFRTRFYDVKDSFDLDENGNEISEEPDRKYWALNYLDFTNPNGESLIMNSYDIETLSVYINDVLIPPGNLAMIYHLMRRRTYHWSWYKENGVTKQEIINYLASQKYIEDTHSKMYHLCVEMHLVERTALTSIGRSLLEEGVC